MLFLCFFFFFNDTATTEIYTLSLHDALPIYHRSADPSLRRSRGWVPSPCPRLIHDWRPASRSEEHTSELQSRSDLVCRLLLEKKKNVRSTTNYWPVALQPLSSTIAIDVITSI